MIINRKKSNPYRCEGVLIMPGVTEIQNPEDVKKLKANKQFQYQIDNGVMLIVSGRDDKGKKVSEPSEMTDELSIGVIEQTFDAKTLDSFKEKEIDNKGRGKVINFIDKQIKSLTDHHN